MQIIEDKVTVHGCVTLIEYRSRTPSVHEANYGSPPGIFAPTLSGTKIAFGEGGVRSSISDSLMIVGRWRLVKFLL